MVYAGYGDDSADETKQRVFAVACVSASTDYWREFKRDWRRITKGRIFHAADCDSNQGTFAHTSNATNKKLYADLSKLIGRSRLIGAAAAVSIPDYNELIGRRADENPFYLCFINIITGQALDTYRTIPRGPIKFTFDSNTEIEYNAGQLYQHLISDVATHPYRQIMSDEIAFATRRTIGIQVADLLAREAMKKMDNMFGPTQRPPRLALQAIEKNKAIHIELYHRSFLMEYAAISGVHPYPADEYVKWLKDQNLDGHTLARRLSFEATRRRKREKQT